MASTRDFKSLDVIAADANTVIPPIPNVGDSYRDTTTTIVNNREGEKYDTIPNSAFFNQKMFILSSFTNLLDKQGIIGWTNLVDYVVPSYTMGSDGLLYFALQNSGPSGIGAKDPISESAFWKTLINDDSLDAFIALLASNAGAAQIGTTSGQTTQFEINKNAVDLQDYKNLLGGNTGASQIKTTLSNTVQQELDIARVFATNNYNATITSPSPPTRQVTFTIPAPNNNYVITWAYTTIDRNDGMELTSKTATGFEVTLFAAEVFTMFDFVVFL